MSRPRYAPVTSRLLVRKGEARPWEMPETGAFNFEPPTEALARPPENTLEREDEERIAAEYEKWMREREIPPSRVNGHAPALRALGDEHPRRCTVRLSNEEYERIGIIAVKREITRHEALHQAVQHYLATAGQQYRSRCNCLGGACNGSC